MARRTRDAMKRLYQSMTLSKIFLRFFKLCYICCALIREYQKKAMKVFQGAQVCLLDVKNDSYDICLVPLQPTDVEECHIFLPPETALAGVTYIVSYYIQFSSYGECETVFGGKPIKRRFGTITISVIYRSTLQQCCIQMVAMKISMIGITFLFGY